MAQTKNVIRTHKNGEKMCELALSKRDRKLELFTLRHLHNGKQYFGIHCTCSPPPKPIFTLQETENEIEQERAYSRADSAKATAKSSFTVHVRVNSTNAIASTDYHTHG